MQRLRSSLANRVSAGQKVLLLIREAVTLKMLAFHRQRTHRRGRQASHRPADFRRSRCQHFESWLQMITR